MKTAIIAKFLNKNKRLFFLLFVLSILGVFVVYRTVSFVKAEDRSWTQTDWRGGVSLVTVTEEVTTFSDEGSTNYFEDGILTVGDKDDWDLDGWSYRRKMTFDNTQTQIGVAPEDLTEFPIMVKLEDGVNIDYANTNDDGSDIRFVDTNGTELSYEIELWDEGRDSAVWVKVPQIDVGDTDYIYMYYGNDTAEDNQDVNDVWTGGFAAVWHLGEEGDGTAGEFVDSTGLGSDGIGGGGTSSYIPTQIDGFSGYAQRFDGSNDYINIGDTEPLNITGSLAINMWLYPVSANSRQNPYAKAYGGEGTITQEPSDQFNFYYGTAGRNASPYQGFNSSGRITEGRWNYVSLVRDLDSRKLSWYIDGNRVAYGNANYASATASGDPATIGRGYAGRYNGYIDEMWISNVTRTDAWSRAVYKSMNSDFTEYESEEDMYAGSAYLISNTFDSGYPTDWGTVSFVLDSGITIKVRSALNENMSDASDWSSCTVLSSGDNIKDGGCVTDEHRYLQYRVDISMDGLDQPPELDEITINFAASDQVIPTLNAQNVYMGNSVGNDQWINFEPTILWDPGADNVGGNGVEGYCLALDEVNVSSSSQTLDPQISSGVLDGIDDGVVNSSCPYIVVGNSVDLSSIDNLDLVSNKKYYISIKAVDFAGNIWDGNVNEYQDLVWFRYDGTRPENVMYISTPTTDFGSVNDMFFNWPISGQAQATDDESGLLGWQYAVNSTEEEDWMGTTTSATLGIEYIPYIDGTSSVNLDSASNGEDIVIGNNTIYFRSIDVAGNVSTYVTGGLNYGGAAPDFPAESIVTVTPEVSTSNEFALSWPEATVHDGENIESYYYMINTQPPSSLSTLENNNHVYIPTETLSVELGKIVGAVKGTNNVYVVAVDNNDNYSPTKAIHGTFELNSTLPDAPSNVSTADLSIKNSELWRVAITWEEPVYKGNGDLTYLISRSEDDTTWEEISSTTGLSYTDIVPESKTYYYKVASQDTSNESEGNPTYSTSVELFPKGRFEEPAELVSEPVVGEITTRYAKVEWVTDRGSDSKVQIGVESNVYFQDEMYRSEMVTDHEIELTNLQPGTTYYYRVKWTDEDGNTGVSDESLFQTKPAPLVEDIVVDTVGLNYAILKLTTSGATKAQVVYGRTKTYGASQEINTSTVSSEYSIMLTELEDGTEYHYKIILTDEEGYEYESFEDHVFLTPPRPQVSNVQIQEKKDVPTPTVEVFWESNIAINSIVKYSSSGKSLDKVDMELIEGEHMMEISNLDSDTGYQLVVEGVDSMGNRAISDVYSFTTATDTRPPQVFGIKSEGDVQSSDVQSDRSRSAQLVISWETDEPSTSQVLYGEGAGGDGYPFSTQTDSEMRYKHVVVVSNLSPSKVYHFKIISKDSAANTGESGSVTAITPKSTDTVIESVLGSLSRIFGFL